MDYAARLFVRQNSVGEFAADKRNDLPKNTFLYHWKCAIGRSKMRRSEETRIETHPYLGY